LASSFLPQATKEAATVAARAMRPSVRLLIMGLISVVECRFVQETVFLNANGLEAENRTK
jgi:hypothetical protein